MIYHMVPADFWNSLSGEDPYESEKFADEGYIHTSHTPEQLISTANRLYKGDPEPYLILCIDESKLNSEIRWEMAHEEEFPHIYGFINRDAVTDVVVFPREADGTFVMPEDLPQ